MSPDWIVYILILIVLIVLLVCTWMNPILRIIVGIWIVLWLIIGLILNHTIDNSPTNAKQHVFRALPIGSKGDYISQLNTRISLKKGETKKYRFKIPYSECDVPDLLEVTFTGVKCYDDPTCVEDVHYTKTIAVSEKDINWECETNDDPYANFIELDIYKKDNFFITVSHSRIDHEILFHVEVDQGSTMEGHLTIISTTKSQFHGSIIED
jgi:hypothetical protein